jgi:uncharacterized protein
MSTQHARVDLREFSLRPGERARQIFDLPMSPVIMGGQTYEVLLDDGGVVLQVERVTGGFLVSVSVGATVYGPCVRCLKEVRRHVKAEEEEFIPLDADEYEEGDLSPFVEDLAVDVAGLAREVLILGLPEKILCRDECPGLCPSCGRELAEGPCGCAPPPVDSRWEKLRDLEL